MVMLLLRTETRGMLVQDIASLIEKAFTFRMSVHGLSNIMRPHLADGTIIKETIDRKVVWRLAYEPNVET